VLVAFAAVSLVVSSIMIGIITYVSVLERTKEIGILRSLGARKKDISRVFNAESSIIGFFAGVLGILITVVLSFPLNNLLEQQLTGFGKIVILRVDHAIYLILVSITLTFIAGLIPASIAAKKDPVKALRHNE
jgi:putative ABC transport system permease protein